MKGAEREDRDINAALNIRMFALQEQNLVCRDSRRRISAVEPVDPAFNRGRMEQEATPKRRVIVDFRG